MQTKLIVGAILLGAALVAGTVLLSGDSGGSSASRAGGNAGVGEAVIEDGVQYIDITARGGYSPRTTKAKAGVPTIIRMKTKNTYDCSAALVIPDIEYQSFLPNAGVTEIQVPAEKAQGTLRGMCSMAMYNFEINFEE